MKPIQDIYGNSLSLLTDFYQLTMAYGYWKEGIADRQSVFNLFFRSNPFKGGYTICCGLNYVIEFLNDFRYTKEDLGFLKKLTNEDGSTMFDPEFLDYLGNMEFSCHVDAIPEGSVVFPNEPLIRVQGPIFQAQLLESPMLNMVNYQSLVATKSSRICTAAGNDRILEFGLRRAQGMDGALSASRAAYIGGCHATSNVLAGKVFGIPVAGTHAHSWVMAFDSELEAFKSYASSLPDNCIFLIDTYDVLQGARHAIEVGKSLKSHGKSLMGVRIDSGDLAYLSNKVRKLLDQNGFEDTKIVVSNDLDEYLVTSLVEQNSSIDIWGIGTKLVTAFDQPALGGVYKLAAIRKGSRWDYRIKLSEQSIKINNPGIQQVRRFSRGGTYIADMIYDVNAEPGKEPVLVDPADHTRRKRIKSDELTYQDLLVPVFRSGKLQYQPPTLDEIRSKTKEELKKLDQTNKRLMNPHQYTVGLEQGLHHLKTELILGLRSPS